MQQYNRFYHHSHIIYSILTRELYFESAFSIINTYVLESYFIQQPINICTNIIWCVYVLRYLNVCINLIPSTAQTFVNSHVQERQNDINVATFGLCGCRNRRFCDPVLRRGGTRRLALNHQCIRSFILNLLQSC